MPSLKIIRTRITSVRSTQKITRAMKMVAGARLNRAQQRIVALRPYAQKTGEVLQAAVSSLVRDAENEAVEQGDGIAAADNHRHPLLRVRPENRVLFLVLSGDRGLCGAYNANVNKAVDRELRAHQERGATVEFATAGRKGRDYLKRRSGSIAREFTKMYDALDREKAGNVARWLTARYQRGDVDAIYIIYTEFKSAITHKVIVDRLLPLRGSTAPGAEREHGSSPQEYLYEPDADALIERLLPMYLEITIYRALLESHASELGARMTAMDSATRNAKDMISRLTLEYNRARQAAITKELMEIIGGAEALRG